MPVFRWLKFLLIIYENVTILFDHKDILQVLLLQSWYNLVNKLDWVFTKWEKEDQETKKLRTD